MVMIVAQIEKARDVALDLMSRDETCRNSFKYMILKRWEEQSPEVIEKMAQGDADDLTRKDLAKLDNPRTLVRVAASIQNDEGLYPPTDPQVIDNRADNWEEFTEWARANNKDPKKLAKSVDRPVKVTRD